MLHSAMRWSAVGKAKMKKILLLLLVIGFVGVFLLAKSIIPVQNATSKDWNNTSYWFYPWGKSIVHKGIDIFAKKGTPTIASTTGIVIFKGQLRQGGNAIAMLGAKWRIHYYAHLINLDVDPLQWVTRGEKIGAVSDTGNARGKSPHLHYSMLSLIPNINEITLEPQGWKRMFYINPSTVLTH
jgi:peptidoglycan LD-endopeptidase LytH